MMEQQTITKKKTCRKAGILMPIFSLPGRYGIGTLGKEARRFADFLREAGQSYWQILPVGPTGYGDSPYQSFSTFAGNPYFIDLEQLTQEGLLTPEECDAVDFGGEERYISYEKLYLGRFTLLEKAFARFTPEEEYRSFAEENRDWLEGYAAFMSDKEQRSKEFYCFLQFEFMKQWMALKDYVNRQGIQIIGDIPIYVAGDSSDVLQEPALFQLTEEGIPRAVAGCPPDAFSATGQLWGNPLYDWEYHRKTGYRWWIRRMEHCFRLFDVVRVDHFRGFDAYYSIPYGEQTAVNGHWEEGPGLELFQALKAALGEDRRIIAEDLGYVTDSVKKLVEDTGFPGMKLLQFAFDSREEADYRPCTWPENCVAYTGTHDNQTLLSWPEELSAEDLQMAAEYLHRTTAEMLQSDYVRDFIEITLQSRANTAIIPLQDYRRLDKSARINKPSTLGRNWSFRFVSDDFDAALLKEIRELTKESDRDAGKESDHQGDCQDLRDQRVHSIQGNQ